MTITIEELEHQRKIQILKDNVASKAQYCRAQVADLERAIQFLQDAMPDHFICDFNVVTHIKRPEPKA